MGQALLSLGALILCMTLLMNFNRSVTSSHRNMVINEMATPSSAVAVEILEHIGQFPFDEKTDTLRTPDPVTQTSLLTQEGDFGDGLTFQDALDIDDFHSKTVEREYEGYRYEVDIDVRYVLPEDPVTPAPGPTWAKEVLLQIRNQHLPFTIQMSRVFTYDTVTS